MSTLTKIKWGIRLLVALLLFAFFHYELPQHDIVQITNTYNRQTAVGTNAIFYGSPDVGTAEGEKRDMRFIEARYADGEVIVYRNEDTGWVWPPYFKYDSSNLQAEAGNLKVTDSNPDRWAVVTHYGWRAPWLSIYPNAVAVRAASGPDERIFPWVNILILTVLAALVLLLWRMWAQFRERTLDPIFSGAGEAIDKADATADAARARVGGVWSRFAAWLGTWRAKK